MAKRQNNKDFGYRRIWGKLRKEGLLVNRKKVQRLVQKLGLQNLNELYGITSHITISTESKLSWGGSAQ